MSDSPRWRYFYDEDDEAIYCTEMDSSSTCVYDLTSYYSVSDGMVAYALAMAIKRIDELETQFNVVKRTAGNSNNDNHRVKFETLAEKIKSIKGVE